MNPGYIYIYIYICVCVCWCVCVTVCVETSCKPFHLQQKQQKQQPGYNHNKNKNARSLLTIMYLEQFFLLENMTGSRVLNLINYCMTTKAYQIGVFREYRVSFPNFR